MAAPVTTRPVLMEADGGRPAADTGRIVELVPDDAADVTPGIAPDVSGAPPEIIRFRSSHTTLGDEYYQALGAAAQVRLRLLGTMHARAELDDATTSEQRRAVRERLAAQRRRVWRQLQWITTEMRRLDGDS